MLKITPESDHGTNKLTLEGKISGPWVDELERCWSELRSEKRAALSLSLKEVSFFDARGKELLLRMERENVSLVDCPLFIRQLLQSSNNNLKKI